MTDPIQVYEGDGIDPPDELTRAVNELTPSQLQRLMLTKRAVETGNWEVKSIDFGDFPSVIRRRLGLSD